MMPDGSHTGIPMSPEYYSQKAQKSPKGSPDDAVARALRLAQQQQAVQRPKTKAGGGQFLSRRSTDDKAGLEIETNQQTLAQRNALYFQDNNMERQKAQSPKFYASKNYEQMQA